MAFMGSTAIGGPLVGVIGEIVGPRASLAAGAAGCVAAVALALVYGRGRRGAQAALRRRPSPRCG
jgi:predicted MFS family arabinose efflux permease